MENLLTRQEVCEHLKVSIDTLQRLIAKGEIQALRVGGRGIRVSEEALEAYLSRSAMVAREG